MLLPEDHVHIPGDYPGLEVICRVKLVYYGMRGQTLAVLALKPTLLLRLWRMLTSTRAYQTLVLFPQEQGPHGANS